MEGGPKDIIPRRPEEVTDYFLFVDILHTTEAEKELLRSLVTDKKAGKLELFLGTDYVELGIDPSKTDVQLADEISEAIEKAHGDRDPVQIPETKLIVIFTPAMLH
jgi:hypothetical protein